METLFTNGGELAAGGFVSALGALAGFVMFSF
jgi:hypothetical protein